MHPLFLLIFLIPAVGWVVLGIVAFTRSTPGKYATSPPRQSRAARKALRRGVAR